jgi:hypothetical protein
MLDARGCDGPANLLAAFTTVVAPLARRLGPVVVLDAGFTRLVS